MKRAVAVGVLLCVAVLGACADDPEEEIKPGASGEVEAEGQVGFDTLDANGDSSLDADELAEWTDDVGTFEVWDVDSDSEVDVDEIAGNAFEVWDADDDGTITEQEWKTSAELWYPEDLEVIVYQDVDSDGDSEIDADEFAEAFDFSVLGESWSAESFDEDTFKKAYFELYDADNDGEVTESEWDSGYRFFGTTASV